MEHDKIGRKSRRRLRPWVGPWLRSVRKDSAPEVARRLERDLSYVSRLETGGSSIPADDLPLVLRAYRVTLAAFLAVASEQKITRRTA